MQHIRLPPDSSGKRVAHKELLVLPYINGTVAFILGDIVTGTTSGIVGRIVEISGSVSTGTIKVQLMDSSVSDTASTNENLTVNGTPYAQASTAGIPYYAQANVIVGANDLENGQNVDRDGSAFVRFTEGAPALDSFNRIKTAAGYTLGYYDFAVEPQDDLFYDKLVSGGAITYNSDASLMLLSTTTASGSWVSRTTNRYHFYTPGIGVSAVMSIAVGDAGKVNNTRAWGMFDDENGLRWEIFGTEMNVCIRSSTTGSPIDIRVPRSQWNGDRLDGDGQSGFDIDVTHRNLYWIEFAWLGAGVVRFGIFGTRGERIVCHTFANVNSGGSSPYSQSGTLPLAVENANTGVTASGSEIRWICGAVVSEVAPQYIFWRLNDIFTPSAKTITADTPFITVRAKTIFEGKSNRVNAYPESLSVYVDGGPIKLSCLARASTTGATFTDAAGTIQFDTAASSVTGDGMFSIYLNAGAHTIDLTPYFELTDEGILLNVDQTQPEMSFAATKLTGAGTVTVHATLSYRELY